MGESVTSFDLAVLLALQEHDTHLVQLHYRNAHLPEEAEIAAIATKRSARQAAVAATRTAVADLDRRQAAHSARLENLAERREIEVKTGGRNALGNPQERHNSNVCVI